jgi:hypothetical protein
MKHLFIFLLFSPFLLAAQGSFAPAGAKWTYDYILPYTVTPTGLPTFMEVWETPGVAYRNIYVSEPGLGYHFQVYSQHDSVFINDNWSIGFKLVYDYSAGPGDSWVIQAVQNPDGVDRFDMLVTVDSVGTVQFCNRTLKAWYISFDTTRFEWGKCIVEWVGNTYRFLPYLKGGPSGPAYLRCYTDSIRTCKAVPYKCDTFWAATEEKAQLSWTLSPNPVKDLLDISVTEPLSKEAVVQVYSIAGGHPVYAAPLPESGNVQISVRDLPPGVYMVIVLEDGRVLGRKRMVVWD